MFHQAALSCPGPPPIDGPPVRVDGYGPPGSGVAGAGEVIAPAVLLGEGTISIGGAGWYPVGC